MKGTSINMMLDGRWVQTIVLMSPKRPIARRVATNPENPDRMLATNSTEPSCAASAP